jgi:septal ring factor EnvC (AmiA/AmiB activator)
MFTSASFCVLQRIHELEMELEGEQQRHAETAKSMRRQERRLKELTTQLEEDRTTHERMHDVIDKLHQKLKLYKRQIDDAVSATLMH